MMLRLGLGLNLGLGRRGGGALSDPYAAYAANGFTPPLIADFPNDTYAVEGTASTFGDMFAFSRSSTATYIDSNGVLQTAAADEPRFHHEYENGEWVNRGLLVEPAGTNLLTHSSDFSAWGKANSASVIQDISGPLGPAYTLSNGGGGPSDSYVDLGASLPTPSVSYTVSCFMRKGSVNWGRLRIALAGLSGDAHVWFDLENGYVGNTDPQVQNAGMVEWGDGWYRCWSSFVAGADRAIAVRIGMDDVDNGGGTVPPDSKIEIDGSMLEAGSIPTSYIPTNGSTVTRAAGSSANGAADAPYSGTGMSGAHQLRISYVDTDTATEATLFDWRGDANNRITVTLDTSGANTGVLTLTMVNGGSSATASTTTEITPGLDVECNVAWRVSGSEIAISLNGATEVSTATAIGIPDLSAADVDWGATDAPIARAVDRLWGLDIEDAAEAST